MKHTIRITWIIALLLMTWVISAQELYPEFEYIASGVNNPFLNETANACYVGGSLSGKCNTTDVNDDNIVNAIDRDWMWNAGWHLIRYEFGIFDSADVDQDYVVMLPDTSLEPIGTERGCYEITYRGIPGRYILWEGGATVQTTRLYFDSQCKMSFVFLDNIVAIETEEQAEEICMRDRGSRFYADRIATSFYECVYFHPDYSTYGTSSN